MIELSELTNRTYEGKECFGFTTTVEVGDFTLEVRIRRSLVNPFEWVVFTYLPRMGMADSQTYTCTFEMPTRNVPLSLVAATGLNFLAASLIDEVAFKSELHYNISMMTKGM